MDEVVSKISPEFLLNYLKQNSKGKEMSTRSIGDDLFEK
jgi:hypothetical protein